MTYALKSIALRAAGASFVFAASAAVQSAKAEPYCDDRAEIVEHLDQRYDEHQRGYGLTSAGAVLEVYRAESGSWTLLITTPDGTTCAVAVGASWTVVPPRPVGDPA